MNKKIKNGIYCLGGIYHKKIYSVVLDVNSQTGFRIFEKQKIGRDMFDNNVDYLTPVPIKEYFYSNTYKLDKHGRPIYVWTGSKKYKNYGKQNFAEL